MRVLTVVNSLSIGGTQRAAVNYALGMRRRGIEAAVLTYAGGGSREAALGAGGVELFVTAAGEDWRQAAAAALGWRPEVVHIHRFGYPNRLETELLRVLKAEGARVVETNVFARYDWTEGGRLIDLHLLLNKWCLYKWRAWGGGAARAKAARVVPYAVDAETLHRAGDVERSTIRRELGVPEGRFLFGRVGQPARDKWSAETLTAFSAVVGRGEDIGLLLVGAPDELLAGIGALPPQVRARIVTRTPTSDDRQLAGYFSAMDGFLHTARIGESFGMVLCEAMACGVPVITLSTPLKDNGQLEVVGHRKGGLVALSAGALPAAMLELMGDEGLRHEVLHDGKDWVMRRFGVDKVAADLVGIYEALLRGNLAVEAGQPDRRWVTETGAFGIGRKSGLATDLLFTLLHNPAVYRGYLAVRQAVRGG